MSNTTRFAHLLGECRRQMNGAVVGSMKYYGKEYGLNYGVSLPTLRELAKDEGMDHAYAKYLFQQQVREIQLIALWVADPTQITDSDLDFWAKGIINTEIAEEAAFALFKSVDAVSMWLISDDEILTYTALLSISKSKSNSISSLCNPLTNIISKDKHILASAIVTLLEVYYRDVENRNCINELLASLPQNKSSEYIKSEMEWRIESFED